MMLPLQCLMSFLLCHISGLNSTEVSPGLLTRLPTLNRAGGLPGPTAWYPSSATVLSAPLPVRKREREKKPSLPIGKKDYFKSPIITHQPAPKSVQFQDRLPHPQPQPHEIAVTVHRQHPAPADDAPPQVSNVISPLSHLRLSTLKTLN